MMSLLYVMWMYVVLFAVIGMLRGWAKELLVAFSVIVALTLNHVLRKYVPMVQQLSPESTSLFWVLSLVLVSLVFFGYLISGTILYYLAQTGYQALPNAVLPPTQELAGSLESLMTFMPPHLLGEPGIYFAVILSFIFVIVVYI